MAHPFSYRKRLPYPAETVYRTLIDRSYLEARLDAIGGKDATLLELTTGDGQARYRLRQGIDASMIPGVVRAFLPGELVIERTETWRTLSAGRYESTVTSVVSGAPGEVGGTMTLADVADDAGTSELGFEGLATVSVPLIGGTIEQIVADQVTSLIAAENDFTMAWLAR